MRCIWALVISLYLNDGIAHGAEPATEAERVQLMELQREIARHDELYFRKAAPVISDAEYDALKIKLRDLESRIGAQADAVPVGDDRTGIFAPYRHREPMLSLAKAYSDADVNTFVSQVEAKLGHGNAAFRVEPKYDGLAVSLTYERGRLMRAVTRGDGVTGEDLTIHARQRVSGLVEQLGANGESWSGPDVVELRGEIFMTLADFKRANVTRAANGGNELTQPRNAAVGLLRALETDAEETSKILSFVCYGWGAWTPAAGRPATLGDFREKLTEWKLPVAAADRVVTGSAALQTAVAEVCQIGPQRGIPVDGVVIKVERTADQEKLGLAPGAPRWAIARKFAPERATTQLLGITWQVGRSGGVTPVAELAPISLSGSKVARATLHNPDEITRNDMRVGDWVWVEKAGEIIPAITGVDLAKRTGREVRYALPEACPACGKPLKRDPGESVIRCENRACAAQLVRRLAHFASPAALDIGGMGPATLEAAVARGLLREPADFYRLSVTQWVGLPGMGPRSAEKVAQAVARSRTTARTDGARLIFGFGFPEVGMKTARRVAGTLASFEALTGADEGRLRQATGLGEAAARQLRAYLQREDVAGELKSLSALGVGKEWNVPGKSGGAFQGEVVVMTGTLTRWTRAEATRLLVEAGAQVDSQVTAKTTCVIAGAETGDKLKRAHDLGVKVIDETELERRLRCEPPHREKAD